MSCTESSLRSRRALRLTLVVMAMLAGCAEEAPRSPASPAPTAIEPASAPAHPSSPQPASDQSPPSSSPVGPPSVPAGLRATAQSSSEVALTWQPSTSSAGPVTYEIFRGQDRVARTEQTSAVDSKLRPGTRYGYVVLAVDQAGRTSAPSATACAQTLDTSPPSAPPSIAAVARPASTAEIHGTHPPTTLASSATRCSGLGCAWRP